MKKHEAEQNWWSALSDWLGRHQSRADFLFVYDRDQARLNQCFDRNVTLGTVDANTISKLYQAAAEGRLGLLRPDDMKPQLLTIDPKKMFASDKALSTGKQGSAKTEQKTPKAEEERVLPKQQEDSEVQTASDKTLGAGVPKAERTATESEIAERLREAEANFRQVVYVPKKVEGPAPAEASGEEHFAVRLQMKQVAALEQAVETVRNALSLQPGAELGDEQKQLAADLVQMVLGISETVDQDEERLERERKAREELIAAQNLFIWAAASEKRDQEEFEIRMDLLDLKEKLTAERMLFDREWKRGMEDMSRELYNMDKSGIGEDACKEKIRDYLDGKSPAKQPEEEKENQQQNPEVSGEMWGNALRHFCRFAASEVPLSVRHVQVAQQCRKILQQTKEMGMSMEDLGLDPQERMVVRGTIEMGKLVEQGLAAQAMLTSGRRLSGQQYRSCLRSYLAMKGIEETLVPHVQAYQKEISTGDGPVSALQILMANRGFRAGDLQAKTGRTTAMARLERMSPMQVARMIKQGSNEIADMGRQVMIASCQMSDAPEPVHEPKAPQMGGPMR